MITVTTILLWVAGIGLVVSMFFYTFFPRQTKNMWIRVTKRKRYVVCHLRYSNTEFEDSFNVVPEPDGLTEVKKYSYNLNPKYAIMVWKNRLHYVLHEKNCIPFHFAVDDKAEILFQAMEIQTALNNDVTEYLFTKRKEILILGLFVVAIVAVLGVIFSVIRMNELIEKTNLIGSMLSEHIGE